MPISQKLRSVVMGKLWHIFLREDEGISRFSYLFSIECAFECFIFEIFR